MLSNKGNPNIKILLIVDNNNTNPLIINDRKNILNVFLFSLRLLKSAIKTTDSPNGNENIHKEFFNTGVHPSYKIGKILSKSI